MFFPFFFIIFVILSINLNFEIMAVKKISHKEKVLRHIKNFGFITPWGALREYGNTRLSATIFSIKKDIEAGKIKGVKNIKKEIVEGENRFKEKVRYAKYTFEK